MTPRRRVLIAIVVATASFAAMLVGTGLRLRYWSDTGWAGLNYFPELPKRASNQPRVTVGPARPSALFMLESGRVVVAFPDAPAVKAGITGDDTVRTINGIP